MIFRCCVTQHWQVCFAGDIRITGAYRNQWQSVTVPYRTFALGGEFKNHPQHR